MNKLSVTQLRILARYPTSKNLESPQLNDMSLAKRITLLATELAEALEEIEHLYQEQAGESI